MNKFFLFTMSICLLTGCGFPPSACIDVDDQFIAANEVMHFYSCSQYGESYLWDFGDGHASTKEVDAHTYIIAGKYTVKLEVSNSGDVDVATKDLFVVGSATNGNYVGTYVVNDDCVNAEYNITVTDDSTYYRFFSLGNIAGSSLDVYQAGEYIFIPFQTTYGTDFSGNGLLTGDTLIINYERVTGGCTATAIKQ